MASEEYKIKSTEDTLFYVLYQLVQMISVWSAVFLNELFFAKGYLWRSVTELKSNSN